MIWAYIIWFALISFATSDGEATLQDRIEGTNISKDFHYDINNDVLLSEEDPVSLSFDAIEPKLEKHKKNVETFRFYTAKFSLSHKEELNLLTLDLPPPSCS